MSEDRSAGDVARWRQRAGFVIIYLALRIEGKSRSEASGQARVIAGRARSRRDWRQRG